MRVIVDEDVPASVAELFARRGHQVEYVLDRFLPGTDDYVIAQAASEEQIVVVTWNHRHFFSYANRKREGGQLRYPGMSLITFRCPKPEGLARAEVVLPVIEAMHTLAVVTGGRRMIAVVGDNSLRFEDL